jgi:hypothetical protein
MRPRVLSLVALLVGLLLTAALLVVPLREATAAQATPTMATSPLVGAWELQTQAGNPSNPPSVAVFHPDGTYYESDADGSDGAGTWQMTGPNTAILTIIFHGTDEKGNYVAQIKVRATVTLDASGNSFTAPYTLEFTSPDGKSTGQLGPVTATGTRIMAEAPGTPVGPVPPNGVPIPGATPAS